MATLLSRTHQQCLDREVALICHNHYSVHSLDGEVIESTASVIESLSYYGKCSCMGEYYTVNFRYLCGELSTLLQTH